MEAYRNEHREQEEMYRRRLERVSFYLGAGSVLCTFFSPFMLPCLLGSMAVVFAVLSKGGNLRLSPRSRFSVLLGAVGILLNVLYLGVSLRNLQAQLLDPAARQNLSDLLYRQYGMTLDELLSQLQLPSLQ